MKRATRTRNRGADPKLPKRYPRKSVRIAAALFRSKAKAILKRADLDRIILYRSRHDELTLTHAGYYRRISLIAGHVGNSPRSLRLISAHRRPNFQKTRPLKAES